MKLVTQRTTMLTGGLAALSLLIAACGSSTTSAVSSTTTSATKASASSEGKPVAAAKAEIAKYGAIPTFTAPGPAIDVSKLKGKTVLVVQDNTIANALVEITKGIVEAGKVAGINVEVFNGQAIISTIEQGIQQGINQHVGAIIIAGVAPQLIPSSLAAANAAKIPVIGVLSGQPSMSAPGEGWGAAYYGGSGPSYVELGRLIADTSIVNSPSSGVTAAAVVFNDPTSKAVSTGIDQVFSTCSVCHIVSTQDVEPQYWPTKIAGSVSSAILANPKINYVFPAVDTMGIFATAGVSQAGASGRVSVVSDDASSPGTLGLVQKGPIYTADPGYSAPWAGWEALDQAMRAMSHMQPGNPEIPIRYFDKATLAGADVHHLSTLFGNAYVAGYTKLWGLG